MSHPPMLMPAFPTVRESMPLFLLWPLMGRFFPSGASESIRDLMMARGLNENDVEAALKTYVPSGNMVE